MNSEELSEMLRIIIEKLENSDDISVYTECTICSLYLHVVDGEDVDGSS